MGSLFCRRISISLTITLFRLTGKQFVTDWVQSRTGEAAIAAIMQAREQGEAFSGLFDFCQRVDRRIVNRRTMEALIRAGAFDSVESIVQH